MCKTAQQFVVKRRREKETIPVEFKKHHSLRPYQGKDKRLDNIQHAWIILDYPFYTNLFFGLFCSIQIKINVITRGKEPKANKKYNVLFSHDKGFHIYRKIETMFWTPFRKYVYIINYK